MDITAYVVDKVFGEQAEGFLFLAASAVFVVLGFYLLIKGADIFVDGAVKAAERLKIPLIVIGLTIVAFGTSAPEAAVSVTAAVRNNAGMAIGNVVGSNIFNILIVLGMTGFFMRLPAQKNTMRFEIPFVILTSVVLTVLGVIGGGISKFDSLILLFLFLIFIGYIVYTIKISSDSKIALISPGPVSAPGEATASIPKDSVFKITLLIVLGLAAIVLGSDAAIYGAENVAHAIGISDRIIGLTLMAVGTSLPELITSVAAAKKGKADLAIGNILGSNIFNIVFVLGISGMISSVPLEFTSEFIFDCIVMILSSVFLLMVMFKNKALTKSGAAKLLFCYGIYLWYLIFKG
ncbi:MAG: calcium/sodium antiporter [Oscillospiraceae bacterium]|nr:calcium/sodium antiporter [Oscillospiraceae bacterium]